MSFPDLHSFHIPVLGIGYSIDTPLKVARFGIASVMSIMDDELLEQLRQHYSIQYSKTYTPIHKTDEDHRAKRITAYLNLVNELVDEQVTVLKQQPFEPGSDVCRYFEMLPERSAFKQKYDDMLLENDTPVKTAMQEELRAYIKAGAIDVNIMAKVDKVNFDKTGEPLPAEYSDALASLRGFANSTLHSSVILSAGYNPRLYSYIEQFKDFMPDEKGQLKKKIVLKVSDYRSALVQGKILAKKGLWISEYRIESGLNCGGHAFATEGMLLGPILEDFKNNRDALATEMFILCRKAHAERGQQTFLHQPAIKITVQGGIGTANENNFLLEHYEVDGTGWGSPFLLVPEATNVDGHTLDALATAEKEDYYMSYASPLGIPFNNFKKSSAEKQRVERIVKNRPGSPCYKKFLISDTEFTKEPICTASRQYQHLKIKQLNAQNLPAAQLEAAIQRVTEKDCLCEGLSAPVLVKNNIPLSHHLSAVTICPGPNLAYFSGTYSLAQMVGHIYGRINILNARYRPSMFINELQLYIDYFNNKLKLPDINAKQVKYFQSFKANMLEGINYYKKLLPSLKKETDLYLASMKNELRNAYDAVSNIKIPVAG